MRFAGMASILKTARRQNSIQLIRAAASSRQWLPAGWTFFFSLAAVAEFSTQQTLLVTNCRCGYVGPCVHVYVNRNTICVCIRPAFQGRFKFHNRCTRSAHPGADSYDGRTTPTPPSDVTDCRLSQRSMYACADTFLKDASHLERLRCPHLPITVHAMCVHSRHSKRLMQRRPL